YGIVMTDDSGRIVRFLEKPSWGEVFSDTINTGIYILEPSVLSLIPSDRIFDFGKDLFPRLLAAGHPLFGYIAEGYWRDVGDLVEYRLAHLDLLHGKVKVGIPGKKIEGIDRDIWFDEGARVDFTARLSGAVIVGAGTQIHANARIENSVIGANCVIGEGATVSRSVLWDGVEVGRRARLTECVVGRKARVKNEAFCAEGVVVSDHSTIGAGAIVKANVKVWPYKEVEDGATLAVSLVWGERWTSSLFGRYGITGVANLEISPEFAAKLGAAFGATLGRRQMVITSRDHHKASRMINRALMTGLLSAGVDVADLGIAPIPVVRYQIRALGLAGGTHVRKSPFDPVLLDIRCFDERGMDISPEKEKGVERLFFREDFPVLDYAFGPASQIFPGILGALGVEVISLNAYLDEGRITRTAEEFNASLGTLSNIVRTLGADVGILFDTGGEKLFLVDEKGEQVSGQLALALFALLVMRTHPPGILAVPVTASHVLEQLAVEHGFQVRRVRSLPRSLMETAMEPGVAFVGEEWGGAIFPEVQPAFDGMAAAIKLLEMMAKLDVRLHHLTRSVPETHLIQVEVTCPNEQKGRVMRQLVESAKGETAELVEGVRIHKNEAWVAAIPHPDRAVFQIIAEAPTREAAQQLATTYAGLIEKAKSDA
ncbi:MAG: nucleotidyltransferase, partial [Candidatus Rokubacteria bacterium]|nr:nucleotidyltransferase [Candidatus Rokubacteria bacterium]